LRALDPFLPNARYTSRNRSRIWQYVLVKGALISQLRYRLRSFQ
jgi:hypothetical protein